ncbi:hypothetical protein KSD_21200 [Ktedonobacter sp. SOSP1-85]|nr:hypothetical protein KSD_21200 [Ktedonobacter sp. SOSP1-85]
MFKRCLTSLIGLASLLLIMGIFSHPSSYAATLKATVGPYGPDTCASGYVWREAFEGDHVCVTPEQRAQAKADNIQAQYRVNPQGAYGKASCRTGYVWRESFVGDTVCVTPEQRAQTKADNAEALKRYAP